MDENELRPVVPERHDEMVIYQSEDGSVKVDVLFENETVWLTQQQMSLLFQKDISVISRHIRNIFDEGELDEKSNLHFLQIPNSDRPVRLYNLDVIISVGYRVKSHQGTQFRIWASRELSSYVCQNNVLTGSTRVLPLFDSQTLHWFVYRVGVGNFGYKLAA